EAAPRPRRVEDVRQEAAREVLPADARRPPPSHARAVAVAAARPRRARVDAAARAGGVAVRWLARFRRRRDEEIDEELESHLRMAIQDRIERGEPPDRSEEHTSEL